jgi:hypothetical protein
MVENECLNLKNKESIYFESKETLNKSNKLNNDNNENK